MIGVSDTYRVEAVAGVRWGVVRPLRGKLEIRMSTFETPLSQVFTLRQEVKMSEIVTC